MELLVVFLLAVALMAFVFVGMAISILIKKGGKFPNTHISGNAFLKRKGIYCAQTQDKIEQRKGYKKQEFGKVKLLSEDHAVQ